VKAKTKDSPLTTEEVRLIRRIAGRKPTAAPHLLEYLLERIGDAMPGRSDVPPPPDPEPPPKPRRTIRVPAIGQRVKPYEIRTQGHVSGIHIYDDVCRVTLTMDDGARREYDDDYITPIGDDPKWITIELPSEEESSPCP